MIKFRKMLSAGLAISLIFGWLTTWTMADILDKYDRSEEWAFIETEMYAMAKEYVARLEQELKELKAYVKDYEETTLRHLEGVDPTKYGATEGDDKWKTTVVASNPLLLHRMGHRLVTRIPKLQKTLLPKNEVELKFKDMLAAFTTPDVFQNRTEEIMASWPGLGTHAMVIPTTVDLEESVEALSILYDTYQSTDLLPENFAARLSPETSTPIEINAYHATQISLKAVYQGLYGNALDWIVYALNRTSFEGAADDSISRHIIQYTGEFIRKSHNSETEKPPEYVLYPKTPLNFYSEKIKESILNEEMINMQNRTKWRMTPEVLAGLAPLSTEEDIALNFYSLCTNKEQFGPQSTSKLTCYYDHGKRLLYSFFPVKAEVISLTPKMIIYYDILFEEEITDLREILIRMQGFYPINFYDSRHAPDLDGTRKVPEETGSVFLLGTNLNNEVVQRLEQKTELLAGWSGLEQEYYYKLEYVAGRYETLKTVNLPTDESRQLVGLLEYYISGEMPALKGGESLLGRNGPVIAPIQGSVLYREVPENDLVWSGTCPVLQSYKMSLAKFIFAPKEKTAKEHEINEL